MGGGSYLDAGAVRKQCSLRDADCATDEEVRDSGSDGLPGEHVAVELTKSFQSYKLKGYQTDLLSGLRRDAA